MRRLPSSNMQNDAHTRRLTRIAMASARANGSMGGDYAEYIGNFDHVEFEKETAGDYRAVIEGVEFKISRQAINHRRNGGEWVIDYRPVSKVAGWDFGFRPMGPIFAALKDARAGLFGFIGHADGAAIWGAI